MRHFYFVILFIFSTSFLNAQTLDWAGQFSSENGVSLNDLTTDAQGNIYACGTFGGTADFDPESGVFELTGGSFIAKLNASGELIWATALESLGIRTISVDQSGNVYLGYNLSGTADFDPGMDELKFTADGFGDIVIVKLSSTGDLVWAKQLGGPDSDNVYGMDVEANGTVYITGTYGETMDFDPGPGTANLTVEGGKDVYILKLDASGDFVWVKDFGGPDFDYSNDLLSDGSGDVYLWGEFSGTVDFDPGSGSASLTAQGSADLFMSKFDASGNHQWSVNFGGEANTVPYDLEIDNNGSVYVCGTFKGTGDFDPSAGVTELTGQGVIDSYIGKFSTANGSLIWARSFGGDRSVFADGITVDAQGNVFTTGGFSGDIDFDPGSGEAILMATDLVDSDIFISRLDSDGNYECAVGMFAGATQIGSEIISTSSGKLILSGIFESTVDFDPGSGVTELTALGDPAPLSDIEADVFIIQVGVDACPSVGVAENTFDHQIDFYPNPTTGSLNLDLGRSYESLMVRVTDISGREVSRNNYDYVSSIELELVGLSGMYLIEVQAADHKAVMKVVKW